MIVTVSDLRRGMIVLENDIYVPCVHKVLSDPYICNGLLVVDTLDIDDFNPCQLGGEKDLQILVYDGKDLTIREIYSNIGYRL